MPFSKYMGIILLAILVWTGPWGCAGRKTLPTQTFALHWELPTAGLTTVRIVDGDGKLRRTLWENRSMGPGPVEGDWDGLDGHGKPVETGTYSAELALGRWSLEPVGFFGGVGAAPGRFLNPRGISAYPQGVRLTVAVADTGNQRLQLLTDQGSFLQTMGQFGTGDGRLNQPTDVDWDGQILTACDSQNRRLARFDAQGTYLGEVRQLTGLQTDFSNSGPMEFQTPLRLQRDGSGVFWVSDPGQGLLFRLTSTGGVLEKFGQGIAVPMEGQFLRWPNGDLWLQTGKDALERYDSGGKDLGSVAAKPRFQSIRGLAAVQDGFALVTDGDADALVFLDRGGVEFNRATPTGVGRPGAFTAWKDQVFLIDEEDSKVGHFRVVPESIQTFSARVTVGVYAGPSPR